MTAVGHPVLEALVDALPVGILVFDRSGRIHLGNSRALSLLETTDLDTSVRALLDIDPTVDALTTTTRGLELREFVIPDPDLRAVTLEPQPTTEDTLGPYVAMLGHELRNPLAPLRLAAAHLRNPEADRDEACAIVDRHTAHMSRLVDDLLDTARLVHGQLGVQEEWTPVLDAITAALQSVHEQIDARGHTLRTQVDGLVRIELYADPIRITQALTNLLTNAVRFTPDGGTIELRGWVDDGRVFLQVEDDGEGIAPDALESIFDTFAQRRRSTEHPTAGLGLGLGLAREIARLHGGTLHAQSEGLGKGARFTVTLPGTRTNPAGSNTSTKAPTMSERSVLIVDDNEDAGTMLALILRSHGASCTVVHTGRAAIDAVRAQRFDVVVVDIGLPDIDGFEVARQLHGSSHRPTRMVALSGYGQQRDRDAAAQAGFDAYFVKPLPADAIDALVG